MLQGKKVCQAQRRSRREPELLRSTTGEAERLSERGPPHKHWKACSAPEVSVDVAPSVLKQSFVFIKLRSFIVLKSHFHFNGMVGREADMQHAEAPSSGS